MRLPILSRRTRGRYIRASALGFLIVVLLDLFSLLSHYHTFQSNLKLNTIATHNDLPGAVRSDKIYIQAQFWTSALALGDGWIDHLLELVQVLGARNVFVSIVESGSLDNTKEYLRYLDAKLEELGAERRVLLSEWSHADEVNSVHETGVLHFPDYAGQDPGDASDGSGRREWEVRRIPFLARERNRGLEPLVEMGNRGRRFDKILVLNDVVFQPEDVLTLLGTRQGRYTAACALDFHHAHTGFYDTFALRDSEGQETVQRTFPYFRSEESRRAILRGMPARVRSCWNGMVVMDASPFYAGIGEAKPGLSYRGIEDSLAEKHVEGSECCLIWADMEATGSTEAGLWVNPAVRVGYVKKAYADTHFGINRDFISGPVYVKGVWKIRLRRWLGVGKKQPQVVRDRVVQWKQEGTERNEVGEMCLIDEMHLLIWNGWKHF